MHQNGFSTDGQVFADAPEIGLRDSARLLNCPDATDDTIGIHEPDTPIKQRVTPCWKKVPWYKRHGHANATLARRHRRPHPRRHNPDGLGAPTPGDAADGVVVAAPAPQGISSALEALAALHQKGALTDGEFAAAKAKLLG